MTVRRPSIKIRGATVRERAGGLLMAYNTGTETIFLNNYDAPIYDTACILAHEYLHHILNRLVGVGASVALDKLPTGYFDDLRRVLEESGCRVLMKAIPEE